MSVFVKLVPDESKVSIQFGSSLQTQWNRFYQELSNNVVEVKVDDCVPQRVELELLHADCMLEWIHTQEDMQSNVQYLTNPYIIALMCRLQTNKLENERKQPFDVTRLPFASWQKLYPYQKQDIETCCLQKKQFLFLEMGLGKTCIAVMSALYHREQHWPLLVVAPSSLVYNWQTELLKWSSGELTPEDICLIRKGSDLKKKSFSTDKSVYILSYSLLNSTNVFQVLQNDISFDSCILDECHYVKSCQSKRSKQCYKLTQGYSVKYMLSGTPFSYPIEIYAQLRVLDKTLFPHLFHYRQVNAQSEFFFAEHFTHPKLIRMGLQKHWEFKGYRNKQDLSNVLRYVTIRRRKNQVLTELPPKLRELVYLTPSTGHKKLVKNIQKILGKQNERQKQMTTERKAYVEQHGEQKNFDFSQAYRLTTMAKVSAVEQYLKTFLESNHDKQVVFFHHQIMKNMCESLFSDQLDKTYFVIDGKTSKSRRNQYVNDFQTTDQYQIALLSITACAAGLTLTEASSVIFTELLFSPKENLQAEARCHRIGQSNPVTVRYLILPQTTDILCYQLVKSKEINSSSILDSDNTSHEFYNVEETSISTHGTRPTRKRKRVLDFPLDFNEVESNEVENSQVQHNNQVENSQSSKRRKTLL